MSGEITKMNGENSWMSGKITEKGVKSDKLDAKQYNHNGKFPE